MKGAYWTTTVRVKMHHEGKWIYLDAWREVIFDHLPPEVERIKWGFPIGMYTLHPFNFHYLEFDCLGQRIEWIPY